MTDGRKKKMISVREIARKIRWQMVCLHTNTPQRAALYTIPSISLAALLPQHYLFIAESGAPQPRRIVRPGSCDIENHHPLWLDGGPGEALKYMYGWPHTARG